MEEHIGRMKRFIIYKLTNIITHKSYIGYTNKTVEKRWKEHCYRAFNKKEKSKSKLHNSIIKYSIDAWVSEVLYESWCIEDVKTAEIKIIEQENTYYYGYNSTLGGDGNNGIVMSKESNAARSKALKGIKKKPETIEKFKNRIITEETRRKKSLAAKGKKKPWVTWSPDIIRKRSLTRRTLTKKQFNDLHYLKSCGVSLKEISKILNVSYDIVKKWAHIYEW